MKNKKTIWFDLTNVPHVSFLYPIAKHFENNFDYVYSLRDFAETKGLFEKKFQIAPLIIGQHTGANKIKKALASIQRIIMLQKQIQSFDIKISVGGDASSIVAKLRAKLSITFDDNEKAPNWRYSRFSDLAFWPVAIPLNILKHQGFNESKLFRYNGYKEDMYIADFIPDDSFINTLPFKKYVLLRPENIQANYVEGNSSIVPDLLNKLSRSGYNILFLPRYEHDKEYAKNISANIYVPPKPVNGLDACYYADFVLTGAGTLAREAACLGVPAISFYAGKELLTVDSDMINKGWMFFSRNTDEILEKMKSFSRRTVTTERSQNVKNDILKKLETVLL